MKESKNRQILYEKVLPNIEYDSLLGKYILRISGYLPYKLTKDQYCMLTRICKHYDIELETFPKKLHNSESNELFRKYIELKSKISNLEDEKLKSGIEKELYKIREELILGHLKDMYVCILKFVPNIYSLPNYEDIFQNIYEFLIQSMDNYNPDKNTSFPTYIRNCMYHNIIRLSITLNGKNVNSSRLAELIMNRERYIERKGEAPSISQLSAMMNINDEYTKKLLETEKMLERETSLDEINDEDENQITYEYFTGTMNYEDEYDLESTEENSENNFIKFALNRLLDTLTPIQKQVLTLKWGLNGNKPMSYEQISKTIKMTVGRVEQIHGDAINMLQFGPREKILKDIASFYISEEQIENRNNIIPKRSTSYTFKLKQLEISLITKLPQSFLLELINQVDKYNEQSIYRDLLISQLILKNESKIDYELMKNKYKDLTLTNYYNKKREAYNKLLILIRKAYSTNSNLITEEKLIEILLNDYVYGKNRIEYKTKTKIKR